MKKALHPVQSRKKFVRRHHSLSSSSSSSASSSASSSSSSADTSSSSDSDESDSDSAPKRKRPAARSNTSNKILEGQRKISSSSKHKNVFRLTPESDKDLVDDIPASNHSDYKRRALKALEPAPPRFPQDVQRIVDAKSLQPSARKSGKGTKPSTSQQTQAQREQRRQAFRSLWLKAVADEFGDELDAIRTREPTLGADGGTRLPLFIDALASGSELFSSPSNEQTGPERAIDARQITLDEVALASNLK
nr:hypothetical protein BN887_05316 [Melanopsichium pennsylvanicum 4]